MMGRTTAILSTLALATALSSCKPSTLVHARFVEGRLAFVKPGRPLGCIYAIAVLEQATRRTVWEIKDDYSDRKCLGEDPHFYGGSYIGSKTSVAPAKLRLGTVYEVHGTAEGSKYFGGAFRIVHDGIYRIEDLPRVDPRRSVTVPASSTPRPVRP